jgi:hypothetical protein
LQAGIEPRWRFAGGEGDKVIGPGEERRPKLTGFDGRSIDDRLKIAGQETAAARDRYFEGLERALEK